MVLSPLYIIISQRQTALMGLQRSCNAASERGLG